MKRYLILTLIALFVFPNCLYAIGDYGTVCGNVHSIYSWANGNDSYGIWVYLETHPDECAGGFYIEHDASNKKYVFDLLFVSQINKEPICIQIGALSDTIADRCVVNSVTLE
jgi:hypothetical protein